MALSQGAQALLFEDPFINGDWCPCPQRFAVTNPANSERLGHMGQCDTTETLQAIDAAEAALGAWTGLGVYPRAALLQRWLDLIREQRENLAELLVAENGKPLPEALAEIDYGASYIDWFIAEGKRAYGKTIPATQVHQRLSSVRQPVGICGLITPWNFPHAMLVRKLAPALICGCTLVAKPAELTPYSALALAHLAQRAGIPKGVLNVLCGHAEHIGQSLCNDERVRKLSFTGSTAVGKLLAERCAPTLKRVSLELGGNAPFIVFADANLPQAVAGLMASKFRNSGQTCVCSNRIFVHRSIVDIFCQRLVQAMQNLVPGDGMTAGVNLGPLIDQRAMIKVQKLVDEAIAQGAKRACGSTASKDAGLFFPATLLTGIRETMHIAQTEIFGPVVAVQTFEDEAEVLWQANQTPAGLAAYIYTQDLATSIRVSEALEFGMVGINEGIISTAQAPFGGIKYSGYGREGGEEGLEGYLQTKYLCVNIAPVQQPAKHQVILRHSPRQD